MDNKSFVRDNPWDTVQSKKLSIISHNSDVENPEQHKSGRADENRDGKIWPQIVAAFGATMGAFAFGTVICWSSTAVPSMRNDEDFQNISDSDSSWISSIVTLGALAGCLPAGFLVDRIGRRMTMLLISIPFVCGWILLYFSQNVAMVLGGRFITGMCSGAYSLASPIFIAEISSPKIRGMLLSGFDIMTSLGVLFQLIIGTYMSWRWQAMACLGVPVLLFVILVFVPESPRYLLSKEMEGQASQSLTWLWRVSEDNQLIVNELKELHDSIQKTKEHEEGNRLAELFQSNTRKSMLVGFTLFALQIFSGMTATTFYRVEIFQSSQSGLDEYTSSIIVGLVDLCASLIAATFVDRLGRKVLLVTSEVIMTLSLGGLGAYFYIKSTDVDLATDNLGWLPLTSLVIFVFGYSVGMGAIPYSIVPEILPQRVRALGSMILTSSRWLMAFLVTKFFPDMIDGLGEGGCYWFFGGCCLLGIFFIIFVVPETKGKSLEVIQADLRK